MNLENLNVQEMNTEEMKSVNGGFLGWLIGGAIAVGVLAGKLVYDVINGQEFGTGWWK